MQLERFIAQIDIPQLPERYTSRHQRRRGANHVGSFPNASPSVHKKAKIALLKHKTHNTQYLHELGARRVPNTSPRNGALTRGLRVFHATLQLHEHDTFKTTQHVRLLRSATYYAPAHAQLIGSDCKETNRRPTRALRCYGTFSNRPPRCRDPSSLLTHPSNVTITGCRSVCADLPSGPTLWNEARARGADVGRKIQGSLTNKTAPIPHITHTHFGIFSV